MKKLSILLTLIMLISAFSTTTVSFAAKNETSADCATTLLTDLGIISESKNGNRDVTRAEFVDLVVRALGMPLVQSGYTLPYSDVSTDKDYYYSVYSAYAWGIISETSLFYPDRAITREEAAKIVVEASSYDFIAEASGGWPTGYTYAAATKGLFSGVAPSGFTYDDACIAVYNLINCPLPLMEFKNGEVGYKIDSDSTLIETMWHLTKISGTFTGAQYFGGTFGNGAGEGKTQLDDIVLSKGKYNTDSFYGYDADVYVDEKGVIKSVYIYTSSTGKILEIKSSQNITLKNNVYTYEDERTDKIKEAKIAPDAILVLNGQIVSYDEAKLCPEYGSVKLVGDSGAYHTVIVESYREIVAGTIIDYEKIISDARDSANTYTYDEQEHKVEIFTTENVKMSFGAIEPGSVLWVYESSDRQSDKIIVCEDMIIGEYTGNGSNSIAIDHMNYPITQYAKTNIDDTISMGSVVQCSINPNGEIVYVKSSGESGNFRVGYLVYGKAVGNGMDKKISVRILTADGALRTYSIADRFKINGTSISGDAENKYNLMPKETEVDTILTGVVCYMLNADSQISAINYPDNVSKNFGEFYGINADYNNIFHTGYIPELDGANQDLYIEYKSYLSWVAGRATKTRFFVDSETVNFVVPRVEDYAISEDSDYKVKKFAEYPSGTRFVGYDNNGYTLEKGNLKTSYISSTFSLGSGKKGSVKTETPLTLVSDISQIINTDGMPVTKLTLFSTRDGEFEVYADDERLFDGLDIKKGDLVKVEYNTKNVLSDIIKFMNAKDKTFSISASFDGDTGFTVTDDGAVASNNTGMASLASSYIVSGNILKNQGPLLRVCAANVDPATLDDDSTLWSFSLNSIRVYKYDTETDIISEIDVSAIKSFEATGYSCDRIIIDQYAAQSVSAAFIID